MTEIEFAELIAFGREQRGVEFKGPGKRTDKQLLFKVIRAILSMANRRNGGVVIVGVIDEHDKIELVGLSQAELATWKYDDLADSIAQYSDPNVNFELEEKDFQNKKFVIITVHEFDDIPVLCKKDYPGILRSGACYVRTRRKPETAEIPTQAEMRDLLELATIKSLREFVSLGYSAGLRISESIGETDTELFNKQLEDLVEE